jgi:hypothetical protein
MTDSIIDGLIKTDSIIDGLIKTDSTMIKHFFIIIFNKEYILTYRMK